MNLISTSFAFLALPAFLVADVIQVKEQKFSIKTSFPATLLPHNPVLIAVKSDAWSTFTIDTITPHGSLVKKGDTLIRFDAEDYTKRLYDAQAALKTSSLNLANAEADFLAAEKYNPMQLQSAKLKNEHAAEAWDYFQKTQREAEIREANLTLRSSELRLDSEMEELKQLEKMYKADDLTENTEEIILKRQRESVKFAEAALDDARLSHKRTLEVSIPRKAITLEREAKSAEIALKENEVSIPRNLEIKRLALEEARVKAERDTENLKKLQAAQPEFHITAPADGYFYYGTIQEGRWTVGEGTKALAPKGAVPVNRPFATFIPTASPMLAEAFVEEASMRQLAPSQKGYAYLLGQEQSAIPATVQSISPSPALDGRFRVTLAIPLENLKGVAPAANTKITILNYQKDNALVLPRKALHSTDNGGWEVELKQAEGKTTRIPVTRGHSNGDEVEILNGLTKGQEVITKGES